MKCNSSIHGNMKWISDILISSHSVWHGYSTLHPGFPCLFIMLILLMLSLSPRVYPGWLLASVRSLELIAEKAKPWLQQLLRVQIFFYESSPAIDEIGLHCAFHDLEIKDDFSLFLWNRYSLAVLLEHSLIVCMQLLPRVRRSALLSFDLPVTIPSRSGPWERERERDLAGFTHPAYVWQEESIPNWE